MKLLDHILTYHIKYYIYCLINFNLYQKYKLFYKNIKKNNISIVLCDKYLLLKFKFFIYDNIYQHHISISAASGAGFRSLKQCLKFKSYE